MEVTGTVTALEAESVAVETETEIQTASEAVSQTGLTGVPNVERTATDQNASRIRYRNQITVVRIYELSQQCSSKL